MFAYICLGDALANQENIALVIRGDLGPDRRRYNAPTADHVAAIIPDNAVGYPLETGLTTRDTHKP